MIIPYLLPDILLKNKAFWRFLTARFNKRDLFADLALEQRDS